MGVEVTCKGRLIRSAVGDYVPFPRIIESRTSEREQSSSGRVMYDVLRVTRGAQGGSTGWTHALTREDQDRTHPSSLPYHHNHPHA